MNTAVTTMQASGYEVQPALLGPAEIDAMRAAIGDAIDRVARAMLTPFETSAPGRSIEERLEEVAQRDRAYAAALLQVVVADVQHDPRIAGVQRHPALLRAVAGAIAPAEAASFVIRTRAALPTFADRMSPWHQDVVRPNVATGCARVQVACWIPLADVDEVTGALEIMPGRWTAPLPHRVSPQGHFEIDSGAFGAGQPRVVPMRRGDVLLLDRFVPHRARPFASARGRWSVVMWVKTAGAAAC